MKNKYNWNNIKEISNEKLFEEFNKSSLADKILIYRLLSPARKKTVKARWIKHKTDMLNQQDLEFARFVLSPLKSFITIENTIASSDIKNINELMLIFEIMHDIRVKPITTINAIDKVAEEKSFNNIREKFIEFVRIFEERKKGCFAINQESDFIREIESLRYIQPITEKNLELVKRNIYLSMMDKAGIGKDRASIIIKGLEKWIKNIRTYTQEEQNAYFRKMCELDSEIDMIDITFRQTSKRYFYYIFNYQN